MLFPHFSPPQWLTWPDRTLLSAGLLLTGDCGDELGAQLLQMCTQPLSAAPLERLLLVPSTAWFPASTRAVHCYAGSEQWSRRGAAHGLIQPRANYSISIKHKLLK